MNSGFLLIDKEPGPTSHDVIDALRKITGIRKIGHAGTLDPFASGLLLVAVGREATREISKFVGLDKEYEAEIVLGMSSTTFDPEGDLEPVPIPEDVDEKKIVEAMKSLTGDLKQIPPMHSAIKIGGQKLYDLARKGKEIERPPRHVTVPTFELVGSPEFVGDTIKLNARIECSSGTYVRALARDLGEKLGTAGYLTNLRRTRIGIYKIETSEPLKVFNGDNWETYLTAL